MKKILIALLFLSIFAKCSGDEDSVPEPEPEIDAPTVTSISLDDPTNNGDASDLEISFTRVSDESLVAEYRVFVVPASDQAVFNLTTAENSPADSYFVLKPDGTSKKFTLPGSTPNSEGDAIVEGIVYVVFVLSVADGENAVNSRLSSPSGSIVLAQNTIKITYIGNDGVHITDGTSGVIIDALPGSLTDWNPIARGVQSKIENGQSPFNDVSVAMISHNHSDHLNVTSSNNFLLSHMNASLLAPPQVVNGGINGNANQVANLNLAMTEVKDTVILGIPIQIIRITHFNPQDGTDFASTTENYAYIVELGGLKILHIGDGDLSASNFDNLNLENEGIDIALVPTFNFSGQLTTTNRDVLLHEIAPTNIIGLHLFATTPITDVTNIYPNAIVFNQSLQFKRF